jgi:hypothetical protein
MIPKPSDLVAQSLVSWQFLLLGPFFYLVPLTFWLAQTKMDVNGNF